MQSNLYTVSSEANNSLYFIRAYSPQQAIHIVEAFDVSDVDVRKSTPSDIAVFKENGFNVPPYSVH